MKLQLTLLNATTGATLSDADNPRPQEGLFSGVAGRHFDPTAILTDKSYHTFMCKVLLLSSDINGALIKIKVSRPNADAADPLCFVTRAFRSRARSNVHEHGIKRPRSLPNNAEIDTDIGLNNDISDPSSFNDTDNIGLKDFSNFSDEDVMLAAQPAEFLAATLSPADDAMVAEGLANDELLAAIEASEVEAAMAAHPSPSPGGSFTTEDTAAWSFTTEDTVLPDLDDFFLNA